MTGQRTQLCRIHWEAVPTENLNKYNGQRDVPEMDSALDITRRGLNSWSMVALGVV